MNHPTVFGFVPNIVDLDFIQIDLDFSLAQT